MRVAADRAQPGPVPADAVRAVPAPAAEVEVRPSPGPSAPVAGAVLATPAAALLVPTVPNPAPMTRVVPAPVASPALPREVPEPLERATSPGALASAVPVPTLPAPALPTVPDGRDPRPTIAAALHGGDLPRAAYLIADWERMLLRHQGPRAPQLADVAEAQAQLALATADLGGATERLIEAARLRLWHLPGQAPELATAVDNAVAIWGRLPRDEALRHGAALLALCRAVPAAGVRLPVVEARLAELAERTGLRRRGR